MNIENRNEQNNAYLHFRSSLDIAMGVLYIIISWYGLQLKFVIERYGKTTVWIFASLFILYGAFRIYRGLNILKKIYSVKK